MDIKNMDIASQITALCTVILAVATIWAYIGNQSSQRKRHEAKVLNNNKSILRQKIKEIREQDYFKSEDIQYILSFQCISKKEFPKFYCLVFLLLKYYILYRPHILSLLCEYEQCKKFDLIIKDINFLEKTKKCFKLFINATWYNKNKNKKFLLL